MNQVGDPSTSVVAAIVYGSNMGEENLSATTLMLEQQLKMSVNFLSFPDYSTYLQCNYVDLEISLLVCKSSCK
jgi:hypothetical protein